MPKPKNILQHMQDVHLNQNYPPRTHRMSYSFKLETDAPPTATTSEMEFDYVGRLEFWFKQRAKRGASQDEQRIMRERAQRAIADHLYGDIVSDLMEINHDMSTFGLSLSPEGEAIQKSLCDLITVLRGEMTRFE